MKQLSLLVLFFVIFIGGMAQVTDTTPLSKNKLETFAPPRILTQADTLRYLQYKVNNMEYELGFVRHCLNKNHSEKMGGYFCSFSGAAIMFFSTALINTNVTTNGQSTSDFSTEAKLGLIGGAGLSLIGTIMIIDSEKWLRRAYTGPDGLGIKFVF